METSTGISPLHVERGSLADVELSSGNRSKAVAATTSSAEASTGDVNNGSLVNFLDHYSKHALDEYIFFCIPKRWVMITDDGKVEACHNSPLATMFLLLNTMIGSGILVQAYVFSQAGIVLTMFAYIIITWMIYTGVTNIIRVAEMNQTFDSYANIVGTVLGAEWGVVIDVCVVLKNAGGLLSYILIIGTLLQEIIEVSSDCSEAYCNIGFLTILPIIFFTIPLCLIRNFGHLAIISYVSIFVIGAIVLLVIIGGPIRSTNYHDDTMDETIKVASFLGLIKNIGDVVFGLGYIIATFHAYNAMENKSIVTFSDVAWKTTVVGASMCFITGLVGYLSFRDLTETNVLQNFPGVIGAIFKFALMTHLILYIPGDVVILRASLWKLFNVDVEKQSNVQFISVTLLVTFTVTFIAIMLQLFSGANNLGYVTNITGGLAGSMLYFVAPGYASMKQFHNDVVLYRKSVALTFFGMLIIIFVIVGEGLSA